MSALPEYRVRARNCSTESENTIHADEAARQFGFQGGLVPGIVVFGYAIKPVIDLFGLAWLERGCVRIKLQQPVYDGDAVVVRAHGSSETQALELALSVERGPDLLCATGEAALVQARVAYDLQAYPELPLPPRSERPQASRDILAPWTVLGTVNQRLDSSQSRVFSGLNEINPLFLGPRAMAHPAVLLESANRALMRKCQLRSVAARLQHVEVGDVCPIRIRVSRRDRMCRGHPSLKMIRGHGGPCSRASQMHEALLDRGPVPPCTVLFA